MLVHGVFDNQPICTLLASYCEGPERLTGCITTINTIFMHSRRWDWAQFLTDNCMREVKILAEQIHDPELEGQCRAWFATFKEQALDRRTPHNGPGQRGDAEAALRRVGIFRSMGSSDQLTPDEFLRVRHRVIDRICARYFRSELVLGQAQLPLLGAPLRRTFETSHHPDYTNGEYEPGFIFRLCGEGRVAEAKAYDYELYQLFEGCRGEERRYANFDEIADLIYELPPKKFVEKMEFFSELTVVAKRWDLGHLMDETCAAAEFREQVISHAQTFSDANKSDAISYVIKKLIRRHHGKAFQWWFNDTRRDRGIHRGEDDPALPRLIHLALTECLGDDRAKTLEWISGVYAYHRSTKRALDTALLIPDEQPDIRKRAFSRIPPEPAEED